MEGFLPEKSSFGVLSGCCFVERRLRMSPAAFTASAHKCPGSAFSSKRHLVMSSSDLFFLSATPFLWGVYGGVSSCLIPFEEQNSAKAREVYSPPLSVRRLQTVCPVLFSVRRTKCLNFSRA